VEFITLKTQFIPDIRHFQGDENSSQNPEYHDLKQFLRIHSCDTKLINSVTTSYKTQYLNTKVYIKFPDWPPGARTANDVSLFYESVL